MVSIKDIANKCGVSISTVSKALNGHRDVGEGTRELIRRTAKEMGYSPNSSARMLKTNRSHNIGVLFADEAQSGLTHDHFARVLDSFKVSAENKGYDITFIRTQKGHSQQMTYLEHARFRGFDGVAIACTNFEDPQVRELMASDIPIVTIDYTFNRTISIISNNIKGMTDLTQYAIDMGHQKIAYIYGEPSLVTSNRVSAFYITMEKNGLKVPDTYTRETQYRNMEGAAKQTRQLLALKNPPTCIFYPDDYACIGGINTIRDMGLKLGQDISVAGYDGLTMTRQIEPSITTIVQNTRKIGSCAAEKLISLIEHPKTTIIEQIVIDGELYPGKTIKKMN